MSDDDGINAANLEKLAYGGEVLEVHEQSELSPAPGSARSQADAWAVEWQGTRRDTCYAIGEKMLTLSEPQAVKGWRSLAGALMRLGEKDVPKFMDLIANINAATMVGGLKGKAQNDKLTDGGHKTHE